MLLPSLGLVLASISGCTAAPETLTDGAGTDRTGGGATTMTANTGVSSASVAVACATPAEGCPCASDGAQIACPGPKVRVGNYTSCRAGVRSCSGGQWGACITASVVDDADEVTQDDASPCPEGTVVQWGAVALDGLTPSDSSIAVSAQTAATQAALGAAPSVALGVFAGSQETSWTSADAQSAFAAAGVAPGAWIRLTLTLTPASSGAAMPTIAEWRETSTCVPQP
jgi:hypothetical protein